MCAGSTRGNGGEHSDDGVSGNPDTGGDGGLNSPGGKSSQPNSATGRGACLTAGAPTGGAGSEYGSGGGTFVASTALLQTTTAGANGDGMLQNGEVEVCFLADSPKGTGNKYLVIINANWPDKLICSLLSTTPIVNFNVIIKGFDNKIIKPFFIIK